MTTKEQIIDTFNQYNADANSRWEDVIHYILNPIFFGN